MKKLYLTAAAVLFSSGLMAADLTPECTELFKMTDGMLEQSYQQMKASGLTDADIATAKAQYEANKTQTALLAAEQQTANCKQALDALKQLMQQEAQQQK